MLQGCYKGVSRVLERNYKDLTRFLHGYYKGVTRVLQECFKHGTSMLQVVQACYKSVAFTRKLQGCFKVVCLHRSHRSYPSIRRACLALPILFKCSSDSIQVLFKFYSRALRILLNSSLTDQSQVLFKSSVS